MRKHTYIFFKNRCKEKLKSVDYTKFGYTDTFKKTFSCNFFGEQRM